MINGIYLKLGSLLANYDVKPLSKFGGNRKNRTNSTSHSLRYPGGYRFVRTVTKGLKEEEKKKILKLTIIIVLAEYLNKLMEFLHGV